MFLVVLLLLLGSALGRDLCLGNCVVVNSRKTCEFTTIVDTFGSSTGYFQFIECGDITNPTLGLERGVTYIFNQNNISNWYHPIGFAYFPDGAHEGNAELEPDYSPSPDNDCHVYKTCQSPMYYLNQEYLGQTYDNSGLKIIGGLNFGLEEYEAAFTEHRGDWVSMGNFSAHLTLTDNSYNGDIFYFCHIHNSMSGRIKVVNSNGLPESAVDTPPLGYEYEAPSEIDRECGTVGISKYTRDSKLCIHDEAFVCLDENPYSPGALRFRSCLNALDCKMHVEMRVYLNSSNPAVTFMHQMIPHHENAINMAKLLLKTGPDSGISCPQEQLDCDIVDMLHEIINSQNHQITLMRMW
eukprot:CAMPEP_0185021890 /NCGR_PEP_ID=MMETSP1103-20130426/4594_1 /TAXON_ID=36769 /ORGANISM="Paraphysomonas bandaiensis, Strain Caron Lab Isolate" /LENGTH=352 /DNA_ID=CAMNT_0027553673 /DNA_START=35 /DNA_END=1090 /DNA_ORIENTATION=-